MRKGLEVRAKEIGCADTESGKEQGKPDEESGENKGPELGSGAKVVLEVCDG